MCIAPKRHAATHSLAIHLRQLSVTLIFLIVHPSHAASITWMICIGLSSRSSLAILPIARRTLCLKTSLSLYTQHLTRGESSDTRLRAYFMISSSSTGPLLAARQIVTRTSNLNCLESLVNMFAILISFPPLGFIQVFLSACGMNVHTAFRILFFEVFLHRTGL